MLKLNSYGGSETLTPSANYDLDNLSDEGLAKLGGLPMFAHIWSDHIFNDVSYLRADNFSWHNGTIYVTAYEILEKQYNDEKSIDETENGISYKRTPDGFKIADITQEDTIRTLYEQTDEAWIYILDTENKRFKLPRENAELVTDYPKTVHVDVYGNGMSLGLTDGTNNFGISSSTGTAANMQAWVNAYGKNVGATGNSTGTSSTANKTIGITTDPTKSGIEGTADLSNIKTTRIDTNAKQYLYFYVGAYKRPEAEVNLGQMGEALNNKAEKTDVDGQWVKKDYTLSTATAVGTYTLDLSQVIPNDGYCYEVYLLVSGVCNSASANDGVAVSLFESSLAKVDSIYSNSGVWSANCFPMPVGADRVLTLAIIQTAFATHRVWVGAYRRLGTNQ